MTQILAPLFGEYSTDQAIARGSAHRSGVIAKPSLVSSSTGSGALKTWTLALGANAALGFWAWKTPWSKTTGASVVIEDADVPVITAQLEPAAGLSRHILVVGRWKWIAGPVGGDGQPLGTLTDNMKAAYEIIHGADAATPVDPSVPALDAAGRPPVVLARIVFPQGGTPTLEFLTDTMLDLVELANKLDGMHRRTGDEIHTGKFKVTEAPVDDQDVVRKMDQIEGSVKPYASAVFFGVIVPDAWGTPISTLTINPANRYMASGSDVSYETDNQRVKLNTAGYYMVTGQTYSQRNTDQHDLYMEIWRRPAGTAGASDVKIHDSGMSNNNGGIDSPLIQMVSANAGDWIYFKGVGKRSYSAEIVVAFMGIQQATAPMAVTTQDWSGMEANGQVYPKIVTLQNTAQNNTGAVAWSITGGTAAGFTTINGTGLMTISFPAVGTYTLSVHAVDAQGVVATKTVNLTLAAYAVIPLVINTGNLSYVADSYPYGVDAILSSTGGQAPITFSVVAGAFTTLPDAAVVGGHLTGLGANGTWLVRLQAVDSAASPQTVTKDITVTITDYVDPGPGGGCFEESETFVLMGDSTGKLLRDVMPAEIVKAIRLEGHHRGMRQLRDAVVTDKTRVQAGPDDPKAVVVEGIKCTPGHPWAVPRDFKRAEFLTPGVQVMKAGDDGNVQEHALASVVTGKRPVQVKGTIGTEAGTYLVGKTANGPWFLVHNIKMLY
jgi:hypothetical protein